MNEPIKWWITKRYNCRYGEIIPSIYDKNLFYIYSSHKEYIGEKQSLKDAKNFMKKIFQSGKKYWCSECQDFKDTGILDEDECVFHCTCSDCKVRDLILLES